MQIFGLLNNKVRTLLAGNGHIVGVWAIDDELPIEFCHVSHNPASTRHGTDVAFM